MKAIRVNADYESELFSEKPSHIINQSIEFLALFLSDRPLYSTKKYSSEYLSHVEKISGNKPRIISSGAYENWWGSLKDIDLEKKLNSKLTSTSLALREGWASDTTILYSFVDIPPIQKRMLAKSPFGMSGQKFSRIDPEESERLESLLLNGPLILEPFFDRKFDFSHYVFPDGKRICYENLVDSKFQYKGSVFNNYQSAGLESLSFYDQLDPDRWNEFHSALDTIQSFYTYPELASGFSIDSFIYEESSALKIRFLSEVNYRRTMGLVAYELAKKYAGDNWWAMFLLGKPVGLKNIEDKNIIQLSPGDSRFEMFFLSASNADKGKELLTKLDSLLPDCQFSIKL